MPLVQALVGLFVLGVLVLIHELGHFVFAKLFGVRVISFSIGFGRPLLRRTIGRTEYRIGSIPFGGFVHMAGEHPEEAKENLPDEFPSKPVWQRAVIAAAGPGANYVSSVLFLWLAFVIGTRTPEYRLSAMVGEVSDSSAAAAAGIQVGDSILSINGRPVSSWDGIKDVFDRMEDRYTVEALRDGATLRFTLDTMLAGARGVPLHPAAGILPAPPAVIGSVMPGRPGARAGLQPGDTVVAIDGREIRTWPQFLRMVLHFDTTTPGLRLTLGRAGGRTEVEARPEFDSAQGRFLLGAIADEGPTRLVRMGPLSAVPAAFRRSNDMIVLVFNTLGKLFSRKVSPRELAGPIGIVQMSGGVAFLGLVAMLSFMALIGLNLTLLNLLPLVITDGGLLLFLLLEAARGKPLPLRYQLAITRAAVVLIILLFVYVTFNDILRIPRYFHLTGG